MSQPLKIKVCGISNAQSLNWAIEAGADLVGFVHFAKSPRHLEIEAIAVLIAKARGRVESVVLLVDPDDGLVGKISALAPDHIQLHGHETTERVAEIKSNSGAMLIKALPVGDPEDLTAINAYSSIADTVLLDAKPPKSATRPGGLGKVFDWDMLKQLDPEIGFMLSGGLNPDNVAEAIVRVKPRGVDVSSGVESAPGEKDETLIRAFVHNARQAEKAEF
jgi:phosphoribosylanthranilate isomerase